MSKNNKSENTLLTPEYQELLRQKHLNDDEWGDTGMRYMPEILEAMHFFKAKSILDYGCGKGMTGEAFRAEQAKPDCTFKKVKYYEYDPGIPEKADNKHRADLLVCTDVLEHIEPDCLEGVLDDMKMRAKLGAYLVISCRPAIHLLPDGRNAHLIVEDPLWWIKKLITRFNIVNGRFFNTDFYVKVAAKEKG